MREADAVVLLSRTPTPDEKDALTGADHAVHTGAVSAVFAIPITRHASQARLMRWCLRWRDCDFFACDMMLAGKDRDIMRVARVFLDRLTLKRPRGSTTPQLGAAMRYFCYCCCT